MGEPAREARTKSLFGNYDILETIGQGGMGVVYRAHDTTLDRIVAVKVLREDLRESSSVVARFRREGEAFASLNHPNIVHIYSVGSVGRIPYIAMELIDGEPLSRTMKRDKQIDWKRALDIGEQIAEALASAHDALIIHRDIKPGNILVDKEGHAFVTDFGIAKVLTADTKLTVDGTRLGTPQYMSPERCQNGEVTTMSDIYSLGVVLFQMISGKLPYDAETPVSLVRQITKEPPKRLRDHAPDVPEDVERLIAFMLEKNPRDRPQDARSLARLIARVRSGKSIEEGESGLQAALHELRDAMTPTPTSSMDTVSTALDKLPFVRRLQRQWRYAPARTKGVLASLAIIALAGLAGVGIASKLNEGFAIQLVQRIDPGAARWQQPAAVSHFVDESSGVVAARIAMPDFHVSKTAWTSQGAVAVELSGAPDSGRQSERSVIVFRPYRRIATIVIPPAPTKAGRPGVSLFAPFPVQRGGGSLDGAFMTSIGALGQDLWLWRPLGLQGSLDRLLTTEDIADALGVEDPGTLTIESATVDAASQLLCIVVRERGNVWRLVETPMPGDGAVARLRVLTEPGQPITSVDYAPDGSWLVYATQSGANGRTLWTLDMTGDLQSTELASGDASLDSFAIHPVARRVAIAEANGQGVYSIRIVDVADGVTIASAGYGAAAAWHPSGQYLVVAAQDRKGQYQLWRVDAEEPHAREQLTFLAHGTAPMVSISQDGAFACTGGRSGADPYVVFVELPVLGGGF